MARNTILIVDADAASRKFLSQALQKEGYEVLQAASAKEGLIAAWRDHPHLIIADPVISDLSGEEFATRLRADPRTAEVPLLALSSDSQPARARSCKEAGFNEYLVKAPQVVPLLAESVSRLLGMATAAEREGGLLIVCLSAKGGTGTSSLCANLAYDSARLNPELRGVVADLVLPIGSIADIVGYDGDQNLCTTADLPASITTPEFLQENLPEMAPWKFRLLAGASNPEQANQLKVGRIGEIVHNLRIAYDLVWLDLGRALSRISLPLIQHADLVVMVLGTDLSTVSLTKTVWEYLQYKGVQPSSVYALLNRAVGLEGLTKTEAEARLGLPIRAAMPYLGGNFTLANNLHQPFAFKFPNDSATLILRDVAQQVLKQASQARAAQKAAKA